MLKNMENRRVKHVVVDAIAFFKNVQLQEIAEKVYTSYGVVNEIRDGATRQRLAVLPYDLKCREPSTEAIQTVSEFARKTGDYASLSAVDIRVLALAYQVTKEETGEAPHYKQADDKALDSEKQFTPGVVGFVYPKEKVKKSDQQEESSVTSPNTEEQLTNKLNQLNTAQDETTKPVELTLTRLESENQTKSSETQELESKDQTNITQADSLNVDDQSTDSTKTRTSEDQNDTNSQKEENLTEFGDKHKATEGETVSAEDDQQESDVKEDGSEEDDDEDEDDDNEGWITPGNLQQVQKDMGGLDEDVDDIVVGCMTTDFAMQNVLIQMGIPVLSVEGLRIRRAKSFIMRCYGCFKTTTNTNKKFCPGCGNQSLTKISVSVDENSGKQHLHFSKRKVINTRGMKYSLPTPQGGKHADNPFLVADQPLPQNRVPRKARIDTNVFDPDFVANASPFAMKDVTSRSAELGVRQISSNTSHHRKNPNAAGGRKKGKKK